MSNQKTISLSCTSTPTKPEGQTADYIITIAETGDTFTEVRVSKGPNKTDVLHQASSVFETIVGRTLKEAQWCGKATVDNITVSLNNNSDGTYTYTLTAIVKPIAVGEKSFTNFTHRGAMSSNLNDATSRRDAQDTGADGFNNGFANIKSKTADGVVKKIPTKAIDSNTNPTLYILEYFYLYNDQTYKCPATPAQPIPQDPAINNAQYFRQVAEGNVAVEGRSSNAIILDNKGNTFIVSGINEEEKKTLQDNNYQGNLDVNGNNNSYIAIKTKDENSTQQQVVLGNNNYQTFNENTDNNNIVQPVKETPPPSIPVKGIIIGDSQTPSIKANSKLLQPITTEGTLWKVGWQLKDLNDAVKRYAGDPTITHVFINIGTNGNYKTSVDINAFVNTTKTKFPNAKLYVIVGSWGWGGIKSTTLKDTENFYSKFINAGVVKLDNPIGFSSTHPGNKTPGIIAIGKEIDKILGSATVSVPILPAKEPTPSPTPTPIPVTAGLEEGETETVFLPEREDQQQLFQLFNITDLPRHDNEGTALYLNDLNKDPIKEDGDIVTSDINFADVTNPFLVAYLAHQQGTAGIKSILYYAIKEPSSKVPLSNKFVSKVNINGNMYGFRLYPGKYSKWSTNVGEDFIKVFGKDPDKSYTPGNFLKYWVKKFKSKYDAAQKVTTYDSTFKPLCAKYGVPLDLVKAACQIESGFKPKSGNAKFKGLFALSQDEFNQVYPKGDIYDPIQNADVGIQLLKKRLAEATNIVKVVQ